MASYNYYKTENGYISFPALIETAYESGEFVTFEKWLNENFGSYEECTVFVPADLLPEVGENSLGDKMLILEALGSTLFLAADFARFPLYRLPISKDGHAYIDLEMRDENDNKVGKTIRVKCKVER